MKGKVELLKYSVGKGTRRMDTQTVGVCGELGRKVYL